MEARFGTAYAMVSEPPDDEPGVPIITAEDPRSCIADLDPLRFWVARWGLKMLHDPTNAVSRAYLMRPGRVDVAYLETKSKTGARFSASSWNWDETLSMDLKPGLMPLVPFEALDALGEFEKHMRLLRRIDFMILQQLSIAVLQAFKQRGIKGVPAKDDKGQLIDYDDIFSADPGALWLLPAAAEIWESGQVDLSGILTAVRDYIRQLAAASRTPLSMMEASGENQSAEGAASARAVFDHQSRAHFFAEFLRQRAGKQVGGATRREGHDQAHRLGRVGLRLHRGQTGQANQGGQTCTDQILSFHEVPKNKRKQGRGPQKSHFGRGQAALAPSCDMPPGRPKENGLRRGRFSVCTFSRSFFDKGLFTLGLHGRQEHHNQQYCGRRQQAGDGTPHRSLHVGGLFLGRHSQGPHEDVEERAPPRQHGRAGAGTAHRAAHL